VPDPVIVDLAIGDRRVQAEELIGEIIVTEMTMEYPGLVESGAPPLPFGAQGYYTTTSGNIPTIVANAYLEHHTAPQDQASALRSEPSSFDYYSFSWSGLNLIGKVVRPQVP